MLFPEYTFINATPDLLSAPNPMAAALKTAQKLVSDEPVSIHEVLSDDMVLRQSAIALLAANNDDHNGPVDSIVSVAEQGELIGWFACVWFNGDDNDPDFWDAEDDEE